jgi:RNA polymerase-binding transcription factor DksA
VREANLWVCWQPERAGTTARERLVPIPVTSTARERATEMSSRPGDVAPYDLLVSERAATERRIVSLERDWTGIVESSANSATDDEHDPEGATLAFERAQIESLLQQSRAHIDEVDDALLRVSHGTYGRCETCGTQIAPDRLDARPFTTTCINCAKRRR